MNFQAFNREIIAQSTSFGGESTPVAANVKKSTQLCAAAVLVARDKGIEWCSANPDAFRESVFSKLSTWVKLGLWIASLFAGGSGIWMTLASWILPTVISWFESQQSAGAFGDAELGSLADGALSYLESGK